MERRQLLGILGTAGAVPFCSVSGAAATSAPTVETESKQAFAPPRLTTEDLVRRMKEKGFVPDSVYAHELTFKGVVEIKRDVPLVRILEITGPLFAKAHLHGVGGNFDVEKELNITALIVGHGFGALMLWGRQCVYATAERRAETEPARQ